MRFRAVRLVFATWLVSLGGCVAMDTPQYPEEWAAPDKLGIGDCPALAGVYRDAGRSALVGSVECPKKTSVPGSEAGEWNCSLHLSVNLGLHTRATEIELRQPDDRTLEVVPHDAPPEEVSTRMLRRGQDFSCDAGGLYIGGTSSAMGNTAFTVTGALLLTGGVLNHTRAFARTQDGALVMTVTESKSLFAWGLPAHFRYTSYVRWVPAPEHREERR